MQNKLKVKDKISAIKIIYTLLVAVLCLADQRIQTGYEMYSFIYIAGIILTLIVLSAKDIKAYMKVHYGVWIVLMIVLFPFGRQIINQRFLVMAWHTYILLWMLVVLIGIMVVSTLISIFRKIPQIKWPLFFVWLIMMCLMFLSESDLKWPFLYFLIFGSFYLTTYSNEHEKCLFEAVLNGIILGFFLMQSWCFVFRPFDIIRYSGAYANCNMNALFYLMVFCAFCVKFYSAIIKDKKLFWKIYNLFMMGVLVSFTLLTVGRSALLAEVAVAFITLVCCIQEKKKWLGKLVLRGSGLILCITISFPIVFGTVRYIPPIFHHPVWFWGEYSESRVHSWDTWDSEKFVDIDEYIEWISGTAKNTITGATDSLQIVNKAYAAEESVKITEPVLIFGEQGKDGRPIIYQYFFSILDWNGHKSGSYGIQLLENYAVDHAHNVFLQYGTDFGIPVMILFAIYLGWLIIGGLRNLIKYGPNQKVLMGVIFALAFTCFGMFEYNWGAGRLAMIMVYFVGYTQIHAVRTNENDIHTDGIQTDNEKLETEKA